MLMRILMYLFIIVLVFYSQEQQSDSVEQFVDVKVYKLSFVKCF